MISDRALRSLAIASVVVLVAGLVGSLAFGFVGGESVRHAISRDLATAVWGAVGATLAFVRPRNAVGWLLLGIGMALSVSGATGAYVDWSGTRPHELPGAAVAVWFGSLAWILAIAFLIPRFLLVFPDGRLPSRRWRVVAFAQYVVLFAFAVGAFKPGPFDDQDFRRFDNPFGVGALGVVDRLPSWTVVIGVPFLLLATLGAAVSLVARFRASRGVERQQLKWVAWAVGITALAWVGGAFIPSGAVHDGVGFAAILGLTLAPLTVLVAMLRYRLYDIDAVISKTLVYGALTVVLGATYIGLVLAGQAISSTFAGSSNLAIAASTLVVAALFLPVRSRVQHFVDRRFYRRRYDAERTLEGFGARLREQIDLGTLELDLRSAVSETMQPAHVTLWRREMHG